MSLAVSNVFSTGETIAASEVNQNFDDIEAALFQIGDSNLDAADPISNDKLASRYSIDCQTIILVPFASGADWSAEALVVLPTSATTVYRYKEAVPTGSKAFLCKVSVYCLEATDGPPTFSMEKNGVPIGNGAFTLVSDTTVEVGASDPFANPHMTVADGDVFEFIIDGTTDGTARGVVVSWWIKREITQ